MSLVAKPILPTCCQRLLSDTTNIPLLMEDYITVLCCYLNENILQNVLSNELALLENRKRVQLNIIAFTIMLLVVQSALPQRVLDKNGRLGLSLVSQQREIASMYSNMRM